MPTPTLVPLLPLFLVAPSPAQDDPARLLPANAVALVRVESARALQELARAFAPLSDEPSTFDLQAALDGMASAEARDAGELARLDPERPLYLALCADPAAGPSWVFVAPVANGKALSLHPTFGATVNATLGAWAGVSNRADYAPAPTPCPLVSRLRPGLISAHVDLAALIATFRPLIDMGMSQAEAGLDHLPESPFDVQPIAEQSFELAREFLDHARALDAALAREGDELALRLDYESSAEHASGPVATDLASLLGRIDPAGSAQIALTGKWTDLFEPFDDLVDAALEVYPEPLRTDMAGLVRAFRALDPLLLPGGAMSVDFGDGGMRTAYVLRSSRPGELAAQLEAMMRSLDREGGFVRVGAAERLVADGLEARVLPLSLQPEALVTAMSHGEEMPPEVEQEMRAMFDALYGRDLRFALCVQGELVGAVVAPGDEGVRAALARIRAPAGPAPELERLLGRVGTQAPGFVYHVDFGTMMRRMAGAMRTVAPFGTMPAMPAGRLALDLWGAGTPRGWSGGVALDVAELIEFARGLRELEGR